MAKPERDRNPSTHCSEFHVTSNPHPMLASRKRIADGIEHAFSQDSTLSSEATRELAFHMTDWLTELEAYVRFCQDPARSKPKHVIDLLHGFLAHVPNHVHAAALLLGYDVSDIFDVRTRHPENPSE